MEPHLMVASFVQVRAAENRIRLFEWVEYGTGNQNRETALLLAQIGRRYVRHHIRSDDECKHTHTRSGTAARQPTLSCVSFD